MNTAVVFRRMDCEPDAVIPSKFTAESAGFDIYGIENKTIVPGGRALIATGIELMIQQGYYG